MSTLRIKLNNTGVKTKKKIKKGKIFAGLAAPEGFIECRLTSKRNGMVWYTRV